MSMEGMPPLVGGRSDEHALWRQAEEGTHDRLGLASKSDDNNPSAGPQRMLCAQNVNGALVRAAAQSSERTAPSLRVVKTGDELLTGCSRRARARLEHAPRPRCRCS